ncbi:hypothetical protein [Bacillus sp. 1NLA3E]|jgi:uncharacterized membrane protein|uniref:hypothetical protein n=1 Tax=Bacillus sp. 1NLA3E TaxID=666686 RepID=UPI000A05936A|nr:hypothetical protein [Bacillus sp. 1NLA3E]
MKRRYFSVVLLCLILLLNLAFTQYMVHQYFYQNYLNALISSIIIILLFPIAIYVYKRDQKRKA